MGTIVIANRRILHDQIQEPGSIFEIDEKDLGRLVNRNLVVVSNTGTDKTPDEKNTELLKEPAPLSKVDNPDGYAEPSNTSHHRIEEKDNPVMINQNGQETEPSLIPDDGNLVKQEKELKERKMRIFIEENNLFDREKELERKTAKLAHKEHYLPDLSENAQGGSVNIKRDARNSVAKTSKSLIRTAMR